MLPSKFESYESKQMTIHIFRPPTCRKHYGWRRYLRRRCSRQGQSSHWRGSNSRVIGHRFIGTCRISHFFGVFRNGSLQRFRSRTTTFVREIRWRNEIKSWKTDLTIPGICKSKFQIKQIKQNSFVLQFCLLQTVWNWRFLVNFNYQDPSNETIVGNWRQVSLCTSDKTPKFTS